MTGRTAAVTVVTAVAALVAAVVAVDVSRSGPDTGSDSAPAIPLASSVTTPRQSTLVVPMGHLDDPTNTFWQLFVRPAGSASWELRTPPGVADNGGLVVDVPSDGPLTAAFPISDVLAFSPLARSEDGGKTWASGVLPTPIVASPDVIAPGMDSGALALVDEAGETLLSGGADLSTWGSLATTSSIAVAAPDCKVTHLTSVATVGTTVYVGLACAAPDRLGVAAAVMDPAGTAGVWRSAGPGLTGHAGGTAVVVRLVEGSDGPQGLAEVTAGSTVSEVAFWGSGDPDATDPRWSQSRPLVLPTGAKLKATAVGGAGGSEVAVLAGTGSSQQVAEIAGPGRPWTALPTPPAGTLAVAVAGSETDAFVVDNSVLTVWESTDGHAWTRSATVTVPVPYGSSN